MPSVSILIPCYNAGPYLEGAIRSALAQSADEVILIDDSSSDRSLEIARSFEPQISVETQVNAGAQVTRNRLFALSSGEWIQYLDADDLLYDGKIARQLAVNPTAQQIPYCDFDIDRGNQFRVYRLCYAAWSK
jgi:glycosyltransferase involved in cell wall biosynthesis